MKLLPALLATVPAASAQKVSWGHFVHSFIVTICREKGKIQKYKMVKKAD